MDNVTEDYLHALEERRNDKAKQNYSHKSRGFVAGDAVRGKPRAVGSN